MTKNVNFLGNKKSKDVVDGKPKLPLATDLVEGEIAVNYAKGTETLAIVNESGDVVTFSSDNNFYTKSEINTYSAATDNRIKALEEGGGSGGTVVDSGFKIVENPTSSSKKGLVNRLSQYYDTNIGNYAIIEGEGDKNWGTKTIASGNYSHVEGFATQATNFMTHAEGYYTIALGWCSHTEGCETISNNRSEHASGQYNISSSASTSFGDSGNTLFSVGNGTGTQYRHNAFEIRQNGDIYISSGGTITSQMIKLQDNLGGGSTTPIVILTQAEYDALTTKDNNTIYVIK